MTPKEIICKLIDAHEQCDPSAASELDLPEAIDTLKKVLGFARRVRHNHERFVDLVSLAREVVSAGIQHDETTDEYVCRYNDLAVRIPGDAWRNFNSSRAKLIEHAFKAAFEAACRQPN